MTFKLDKFKAYIDSEVPLTSFGLQLAFKDIFWAVFELTPNGLRLKWESPEYEETQCSSAKFGGRFYSAEQLGDYWDRLINFISATRMCSNDKRLRIICRQQLEKQTAPDF